MSSSYDAGLFPPMETFLHHLAAKKYCNRRVALIQNGTWAPSAAKCMQSILEPLQGIEYVGDVITIKARSNDFIKTVMSAIDLSGVPAWMTLDKDALKITFERIPQREELDPDFKEQLVIEYYSK